MSHVNLRENIKTRIEHADWATLQSIGEIFDRSERRAIAMPEPAAGSAPNRSGQTTVPERPLQFVGENLTLEEFERLSLKGRAELQRRLREQNQRWLQEKFSATGAAWLAIVDGNIIASGKTWKSKPLPPQTLEISQRTGKFPFIFANDKFMVIEEGVSAWHGTVLDGDYYPTLPIKLGDNAVAIKVIGDLDVGSSHTFLDYDFLIAQNIIRPEARDYFEIHAHLNRSFVYVDKLVRIELPSTADEARALEALVSCVQDWNLSPFVAVNPDRAALIGRDILLALKPRVLLDFAKLQTEIMTAKSTKPARRSKPAQKKSTTAKRRRA